MVSPLSRERKRELVDILRSEGCCERCVLRFLKVCVPNSYKDATATIEALTGSAKEPVACEQDSYATAGGSSNRMGSLEVSCDESSSDANESSKSASCHDIDRKSTDVLDNYEPLPKYRRVDEDSDTNPDSVPECHRVGANLYKLSSAMSEAVEDLRQCGDTGVNSLTAAPFACSLCLGILHDDWLKRMTSVVHAQVQKEGFEFSSFSFSISLPLAPLIRERILLASLALHNFNLTSDVPLVKEVLKWMASPRMQECLGVRFAMSSPFQILVSVGYDEDGQLSGRLRDSAPVYFQTSGKRPKMVGPTITSVTKALAAASDENIRQWFHCPMARPVSFAYLTSVECRSNSIYIGGRYCKYSRELSQTPWIIDGERKTEFSVQELICDTLQFEAGAFEVKFCSSGREDCDVRMLGRGRPFCVELVMPRKPLISQERVAALQAEINDNTDLVSVRDLQMIDKSGVEKMKEGESDKVKHYSALVHVASGVNSVDISNLSVMQELTIVQKTPIRVLHRRTLKDRERVIHSMATELIDDYHFQLLLSTQAGTYIKEFVHGDMGRTSPNLCSILNTCVDIVELDVTAVELDWPPYLDSEADDN